MSRSLKPLILGSALVGYGVYKYMNTEQTVGLFPAVSAAGVPESQPSVSLWGQVTTSLLSSVTSTYSEFFLSSLKSSDCKFINDLL